MREFVTVLINLSWSAFGPNPWTAERAYGASRAEMLSLHRRQS